MSAQQQLLEPTVRVVSLKPVELFHELDHKFEKPPKGGRGCRALNGNGGVCGRAKHNPLHYGAVPSLNVAGSGGNHFAYQNAKHALQGLLIEYLRATDLPTGLHRVVVEGEMCFPTRARRDQGNFRYFIEKCLGDALKEGGYLADDDWDSYEFGGLSKVHEPRTSWTRLMLFPSVLEPTDAAEAPLQAAQCAVEQVP